MSFLQGYLPSSLKVNELRFRCPSPLDIPPTSANLFLYVPYFRESAFPFLFFPGRAIALDPDFVPLKFDLGVLLFSPFCSFESQQFAPSPSPVSPYATSPLFSSPSGPLSFSPFTAAALLLFFSAVWSSLFSLLSSPCLPSIVTDGPPPFGL